MTSDPRGGRPHKRRRRELLDALALAPGTPCDECGAPMFVDQDLDADHEQPVALGGRDADRLLHRVCNQRRGQRLSAARNRARRAGVLPAVLPGRRGRSGRSAPRVVGPVVELPRW